MRVVGVLKREDIALVLHAANGQRYELRGSGVDTGRSLPAGEVEAEGFEWRGATAPPPVPGMRILIVRDLRPARR
jgi:hypothetical protein